MVGLRRLRRGLNVRSCSTPRGVPTGDAGTGRALGASAATVTLRLSDRARTGRLTDDARGAPARNAAPSLVDAMLAGWGAHGHAFDQRARARVRFA